MKPKPKFWLTPIVLVFLILTLVFSQPARAAGPWYVAPGGNDGNSCLSAGSPCASLNGAIGKASSGDTIYAATGTYTSTTGDEVMLIDKSLTLSGGWDGAFTTQSAASTIEGEGARRGITVNDDLTVIIERVVIQGGSSETSYGGGIYSGGTLTLNNSTVSGNTSQYGGGGMFNTYYGKMTLNNSTVSGNTSQGGGGGISNNFRSSLTLNNSRVIDNTSQGGGGGIFIYIDPESYSSIVTLNNSIVSSNTSQGYGGGIYNYSFSADPYYSNPLTLNNSTVSGNSSQYDGGGIYSYYGTVTLNNSTVSGNTSVDSGAGGIYNLFGTLTLNDSTVSDNIVFTAGGGIVNNGPLTLNNSTVSDNTSQDSYGGGIFNYSYSGTMTLNNSIISGNTSLMSGGGIFNYDSTTVLNNSTVSGNTSESGGGGIDNNGPLTLNNSTVSGNTSQGEGGGISNNGTLTLQNSILAGNTSAGGGPDCSGTTMSSLGYNLIGNTSGCSFTTATGDITGIPPLLGPLQDNGGPTLTHALLLGSPAIDAGNPAGCVGSDGLLTTDQRGVVRPQGLACDIGAYELEQTGILLSIDIKPKNIGNIINITSTGTVPVAILSTVGFNAPGRVVLSSQTFGRTGQEASLYRIPKKGKLSCSAVDVNGDGLKDLVCLFTISKTGFQCGDTRGFLQAELKDGTLVSGADFLQIQPCH